MSPCLSVWCLWPVKQESEHAWITAVSTYYCVSHMTHSTHRTLRKSFVNFHLGWPEIIHPLPVLADPHVELLVTLLTPTHKRIATLPLSIINDSSMFDFPFYDSASTRDSISWYTLFEMHTARSVRGPEPRSGGGMHNRETTQSSGLGLASLEAYCFLCPLEKWWF